MTEIAVGYGNYTTKMCSTFFVGQPTDDYKRLFDLAAGLLHAAEDGLKPGMTGADVSKYLADAITGDYTYYQPLVMGWSTYLHPPYLGGLPGNPAYDFFARPFDAFALEEGHTFTIIPWVGLKDTKKAVWLGTTYKMTATGVEALTNFAVDELRIV
jgi:Xaa-Pro aminopeptidase